jgi:hypothetical protein
MRTIARALRELTVVVAVVFLQHCGSDKPTESSSEDVIVPLAVGNYWIYQVTLYEPEGVVKRVTFDTIQVVGDTILVDSVWYTIDDSSVPEDILPCYTNREQGFYRVFLRPPRAINVNDTAGLAAKYPTHEGDTFTVRSGLFSWLVTVESTDMEVTVPAGSFTTYCYYSDFHSPHRTYYAVGVGNVKSEAWWWTAMDTLPYLHSVAELIEVKVH